MLKFYLSFWLILLISFQGMAQFHKKYKKVGDEYMHKGEYASAVKNYYLAMQIDSNDASLRYAYAEGLRMTNNYKKSAFYYKSVQKLDDKRAFLESMHYAGEMYKYLGDYKTSLKEHKRYVRRYKGDKTRYDFLKSSYELAHARDLIHLKKDTLGLILSNDHPVNTSYSEFSAFIVNDSTLFYSTLTTDSVKERLVLDSTHYYSRIYEAVKKERWQSIGEQASFSNSEEIHIANASLGTKNDVVYYTECSNNRCKIYKARVENGKWLDFEKLPEKINLPDYTASQPILARVDAYDVLFFISDRPGGKGKLDIWYSIAYSNGLYEDPVNLGDSINSPGNDICPFYMEGEEALYYSSDWHAGLGGFDIFRSIRVGDNYGGPENMGIPFNSSYNDLYFRQKNETAVITSNREGALTDQFENCCNDLFFFEYKAESIIPEIEMSNAEKIERLLPLRLYFHNDEPNPRSTDTSTTVLYSATCINYLSKTATYEREYSRGLKDEEKQNAEEEINYFFESEVKLGYEDLKEALNLLEKELDKGQKVEMVIKAYASPLSKSDYNKRLTLRRISSVKNEILFHHFGALEKYLENGQLQIKSIPFGEDKLSSKVSDDRSDLRNAIYSKQASFERRVEIIAVRIY